MSDLFHRFNSMKILVHSEKLAQVARGELPLPIDWHIYPSNVCNHKCTWCMYRQDMIDGSEGEQFKYRVKLPRHLLLKGVQDAARTGAKIIRFTGGGEPLMNKHIVEALKLAEELGIETALDTNGRLLTPEIAALCANIRVSLNAGTPEQHWKTNHGSDARDPGDWDKIIYRIADCVNFKKRDFGLGFVVDHENYLDIYPFCALAYALGVDWVHIRPAFYYEKEKDGAVRAIMPYALAECERAKAEFGQGVRIFALTDKFEGYWTPRSYDVCRAVWTIAVLYATGDFGVCLDRTDLRFGKDYALGKTFEQVWCSQEHMDLIQSIRSPGILDACPRCVLNSRNQIIQDVFINDEMRLNMV